MKILRISSSPLSAKESAALEEYGMIVCDSSPTLFSALTAMRISRKADEWQPDAVVVYRQADALAAISAKKIAKHNTYKIIYVMEPNSPQPTQLHKPVREEMDAWIFKSERLYNIYVLADVRSLKAPPHASGRSSQPRDMHLEPTDAAKSSRKIYLLPPVPILQTSVQKPDLGKRPLVIAWIGKITDTERLKKVLDKVDDLKGEFIIRISGGGTARDVMPAVRYARALQYADKVEWVGEEYDKEKEIEACSAAVASAEDITYTEAEILQSGRRLLKTDEIEKFVTSPSTNDTSEKYDSEKYIEQLRSILSEIINC